MKTTLTDGTGIEILSINMADGTIDWRRTNNGYKGVCISPLDTRARQAIEDAFSTAIEAQINTQLENELVKTTGVVEEATAFEGIT